MKTAVITFVTVVLFCTQVVFGQSLRELNDSVVFYYQSGDFGRAEVYAVKLSEGIRQQSGDNSEAYAKSLLNLSSIHFSAGNVAGAVHKQRQAVKIFESQTTSDPLFLLQQNLLIASYLESEDSVYQALAVYDRLAALWQDTLSGRSLELSMVYARKGRLLVKKDEPSQALRFLEMAFDIQRECGYCDSLTYADVLHSLSGVYRRQGDYNKALEYLSQACKVRAAVSGQENGDYILWLADLAYLCADAGYYQQGVAYYIECRNLALEVYGQEHPVYVDVLQNIASVYLEAGDLPNARSVCDESLPLIGAVYGTASPDYAHALSMSGFLLSGEGRAQEAEAVYMQALALLETSPLTSTDEYLSVLTQLASLRQERGKYSEADTLLARTLAFAETHYGRQHERFASVLLNIADLKLRTGKYEQADSLYGAGGAIILDRFGEKSVEYADVIEAVADLSALLGDNNRAEPLYQEALAAKGEHFGLNHPAYALALEKNALFYSSLGIYEKAEPYFRKALEVYRNVYGEQHPRYAAALNNLANMLASKGDRLEALTISKQALSISASTLGKEHPLYTSVLNNLASLYIEEGQYAQAEPLLREANEQNRLLYGVGHPNYATSLSNLANLMRLTGKGDQAVPLYEEALKIRRNTLGNLHPSLGNSYSSLATLYLQLENYAGAEQNILQANTNYMNQIEKSFRFLSESEKLAFISNISRHFALVNLFGFNMVENRPEFAGVVYNNELIMKGLLLYSSRGLRKQVLESNDPWLIDQYFEWQEIRQQLAGFYSLPVTEQPVYLRDFEEQANDIEKDLVRTLSELELITAFRDVTWQEVQKRLQPHEAAIEFISFSNYWTDSTYYCALILRHDSPYPIMQFLFEESEIRGLLEAASLLDVQDLVAFLYNRENYHQPQNKDDRQLYHLIWSPIEPHLQGATTAYISPSGLLNKISFAAIPVSSEEYLNQRYNLVYLSSTRQLTAPGGTSQLPANARASLFGGIEYDLNPQEMISQSKAYKEDDAFVAFSTIMSRNVLDASQLWRFLPGTLDEIENVNTMLSRKGIECYKFPGETAVEEAVKYHVGDQSPHILHIATHGFFFPETEENQAEVMMEFQTKQSAFRFSGNPLMRSGLVFAGANATWSNEYLVEGTDDGILTSYEVSNLDLSETRLAVLSACETGLGDIKGSEGVFGLQRAFKLAGVDHILMSLWQVPDKQTMELITLFYESWLGGADIDMALITAQKQMEERYPPFFWGAFVLVR